MDLLDCELTIFAADYEPVQEEEDDGSVTPTRDNPGLETDSVIRGTQGSYEAIDAR
jgi:hypothetical protein